MKRIILFVLLFAALKVAGQTTGYLRFDTVKIMKQNGTCELYIINKTKDSLGVLTNIGGGLTSFKKPKFLNDSQLVVGNDTLTIRGVSQNLQQVTDNGNKTTNAVFTRKQLYTPKIGSDSLAEPNFSFILMPDLQGMTAYFPYKLDSMFDWTVRNVAAENIKAVLTVGDLTQVASNTEFQRVDDQFDKLDAIDLPYMATYGNHDDNGGNISGGVRQTSQFNAYFGADRYTGKTWYGSNYSGGNENHYIKFDVGSYKFLVLTMEFCPRNEVVDWAGRVCDSFPDRKIIITTHAHVTAWGEKSVDTSAHAAANYGLTDANNGDSLWHKLFKQKPNIAMVLSGHFINGTKENKWVRRISDVGVNKNVVHQVFINYQQDSAFAGVVPDNGQGWLMKMRFEPAKSKVYTSVYSPYLQQYESRIDSFNIDLPAVTVETSIGVESIYVNKELRVNKDLFLGSTIDRYSVLVADTNKQVIDVPNFTVKNGLLTVPNITVNDLAFDRIPHTTTSSNRLTTSNSLSWTSATASMGIQTANPLRNLDVRTTLGVNQSTTGGYRTAFALGVTAANIVQHTGGNWGQAIVRCDATSNAAVNNIYYRSFNSNPDVKAPGELGYFLARTSFQSPRHDTSSVVNYGDIITKIGDTSSATPGIDIIYIMKENIATTDNHKFAMLSNGHFNISKNAGVDQGFGLWVNQTVGIHKDSVPLVTSIGAQDIVLLDTITHQKKRIKVADLGGGGGSTTLDQAIGNGNALTTNRIIDLDGNNLDIMDGATERMRFQNDGMIGIGTNSPDAPLTLSTTGQIGMRINMSNTSNNTYAIDFNRAANNVENAFNWSTNGTPNWFLGQDNDGTNNMYIYNWTGGGWTLKLHDGSGDISWGATFNSSLKNNGNLGIRQTSPTAHLHIGAGTATANTAPLKLTAGTNLTTPENGAIEFDGTDYHATASGTRYYITRSLNGSTTHDFGTLGNNSSATTNITVTGAADGDFVLVTKPAASGWSNGEVYAAWVSASNTVTVRQSNHSGGSAGFGSQTINVKVIKQ